jgi:hypothetical protein
MVDNGFAVNLARACAVEPAPAVESKGQSTPRINPSTIPHHSASSFDAASCWGVESACRNLPSNYLYIELRRIARRDARSSAELRIKDSSPPRRTHLLGVLLLTALETAASNDAGFFHPQISPSAPNDLERFNRAHALH